MCVCVTELTANFMRRAMVVPKSRKRIYTHTHNENPNKKNGVVNQVNRLFTRLRNLIRPGDLSMQGVPDKDDE
jgi:hypothetical protein